MDKIPKPTRQLLATSGCFAIKHQNRMQSRVSAAQSIILKNIAWVEQLPFDAQRRLEAEMMELILSAELKSKGAAWKSPSIEQQVEREYEDFLQAIQLKEIFVLCSINVDEIEKDKEQELELEEFLPDPLTLTIAGDMNARDDTSLCSTLSVEEVAELNVPPILAQEDPQQRLVRPCVVRIKYLKLEEYSDLIPLGAIGAVL